MRAFAGIGKVMLVSATAFTDRNTQHGNVINAAKQAGVGHIVFMPIIRKAGSGFHMPQVTEEDRFVEKSLKASGLTYTLVRHPPFLENIGNYAGGHPLEKGVLAPAGTGRAAYASREDLAEAHAVVLSEEGHEFKDYALYGGLAVSFADIAQILSEISGKAMPFKVLSDRDYIAQLMSLGLPEPAAGFMLKWVLGVNAGERDGESGDLEKLLGRKPVTPVEYLRAGHAPRRPEAES